MDGNALLRLCREALSWIDERNVVRTQSVGAAYCLGFITGMLETKNLRMEPSTQEKPVRRVVALVAVHIPQSV